MKAFQDLFARFGIAWPTPIVRLLLAFGGIVGNCRPRGREEESPWWAGQDSNLQPDRYERPALTIELPARSGRDRERH